MQQFLQSVRRFSPKQLQTPLMYQASSFVLSVSCSGTAPSELSCSDFFVNPLHWAAHCHCVSPFREQPCSSGTLVDGSQLLVEQQFCALYAKRPRRAADQLLGLRKNDGELRAAFEKFGKVCAWIKKGLWTILNDVCSRNWTGILSGSGGKTGETIARVTVYIHSINCFYRPHIKGIAP